MAFEDLNDKQKEAVLATEGPLLILAGAGSGKTSTMTHRIAHLIEEGVHPYDILAVTFTNKAAAEMRQRVEALIGNSLNMWILTFHAMCLRILHVHAADIGYRDNFVIYDPTDQKTLIKKIVKDKGYNEKEFSPQYVLAIISECKEKEILPPAYLEQSGSTEKNKMIYNLYDEYQRRLMQNNAMDFDDLLLNTVRLFRKCPEVLEKYRRKFEYVMVDEYQDTNHIQYLIVSMLAAKHHNICVVGDDDQCIYEWRGADIRNILDFEKDFPEAKVVKLEQNYRSDGNILAAAHSVIKNNKGRKAKKLWTERSGGEEINYRRLMNDKEEASYVAGHVGYMAERGGLSYRDIAVLYRTNGQSRLFEEALTREGIPYRILSGTRYYDRKEVKDMLSYLRLIIDPDDDVSLFRIINEPKRGIGQKTIDKLAAFADVRHQSVLAALTDGDEDMLSSIPSRAYESVKKLVGTINDVRRDQDKMSVAEIYDTMLVETGYMKMLEDQNTVESEGRIENLMEFKSAITDYENGFDKIDGTQPAGAAPDAAQAAEDGAPEKPTLAGFLSGLALATEVDSYDETAGAVTLMTMHSAKGLEFACVFMPGMEDGLFPGNRSFDSIEGMEEERRLCYVGITRAKKYLFLTSAEARTRYGRTEFMRESQFLREIDEDLLQGDKVYKKRPGESSLGVSTGSFDGYAGEPVYPFGEESDSFSGAGRRAGGYGSGSYGGPRAASGSGYGTSGSKPFDSLKYAKRETVAAAKKTGGAGIDLEAGDRVKHPKFGSGMVIEATDRIVTVAFDDAGIKKLAKDIAPLTKED